MDARSLLRQMGRARGFTTLGGHKQHGMGAGDFRDAASRVTADDLQGIGIAAPRPAFGTDPRAAVDPARMKFDAMMALKRAQQGGVGAEHAQQLMADADMAQAGVDEVLRRRQGDFNAAARDQVGKMPGGQSPLTGSPASPMISALTGAAFASQARAGRPQSSLPQEDRPMSIAEHMQGNASRVINPIGSRISEPGPASFLTSDDVNPPQEQAPAVDGFTARRKRAIDAAVAGLGRAAGPQRMQAFSGRRF